MLRLLPFVKDSLLLLLILLFTVTLSAQKARKVGVGTMSTFEHQPRNNNATYRHSVNRNRFRSIDGTYNNLWYPKWGAADIILKREMPSAYGSPDPLNSMAGTTRKSPREISNILCEQPANIANKANLSSFVFTWGQFIDHDITLTGEGHSEAAPITLPSNEGAFAIPIRFMRSEVMSGTGVYSPREQMNLITSWLDASMVYGSDQQRASWLRTYQGGKLKTSAGNLLPYNTYTGEQYGTIAPNAPSMATIPGSTPYHFVAGDARANEQPGLTALHTLFVREHNRYCDMLKRNNGQTNDEILYQRARKFVGALIQAVTFNEFLPALGVKLDPYRGYKPHIQPDITNEFATAAYRMGHTMVTDQLMVLDQNCQPIATNTSLIGNFFNTSLIKTYGIEPILKGLSSQEQEAIDIKLVENLRSFLFQIPGAPPAGLDLAALNIQRGRDHGLPDYNSMRRHFLGQRATRFNQITQKGAIRRLLKQAYDNNINNIDPWTGLLAEDHAPGANVGPTLRAMLKMQFQRLRDGDYYYYEWDPVLTTNKKRNIRTTNLATIIERNTSIRRIANNIFKVRKCHSNITQNNNLAKLETPYTTETLPHSTPTLDLFPNPASDKVTIDLDAFLGKQIQLVLHDQLGRRVYEQQIGTVATSLREIDIAHLDNGVYILSLVRADAAPLSRKLVVRKFR